MKKVVIILIVLSLLFGLPVFAAEEGKYPNARSWYGAHHESWPDNVCGVWSTDGGMDNYTIAVTNDAAGEARRQEILASVRDDSTLTFVYQKYSYSELEAVKQEFGELLSREKSETGVAGYGIRYKENAVCVEIAAEDADEDFMRKCYRRFGDRIKFVEAQGYWISAESLGVDITADGDRVQIWQVLVLLAVLVIAEVLIVRRRRKRYPKDCE